MYLKALTVSASTTSFGKLFQIYLVIIPGAAAPSEALDPARGLCRLKSMKSPSSCCAI